MKSKEQVSWMWDINKTSCGHVRFEGLVKDPGDLVKQLQSPGERSETVSLM